MINQRKISKRRCQNIKSIYEENPRLLCGNLNDVPLYLYFRIKFDSQLRLVDLTEAKSLGLSELKLNKPDKHVHMFWRYRYVPSSCWKPKRRLLLISAYSSADSLSAFRMRLLWMQPSVIAYFHVVFLAKILLWIKRRLLANWWEQAPTARFVIQYEYVSP